MTNFGAIDVLKYARAIIRDGGDPNPCRLGTYCLRCAISIAKGDLDNIHEVPLGAQDGPLLEAAELLAVKDKGIVHTRNSALAMLDELISESERVGT